MKRRRLGLALGGMAVSAAVFAALWPQAREAGAIVSAQDDPAELSDVTLNSVLRNDHAGSAQNIEPALADNIAELGNSFVDRARATNQPLADELSRRVADAVAEENS